MEPRSRADQQLPDVARYDVPASGSDGANAIGLDSATVPANIYVTGDPSLRPNDSGLPWAGAGQNPFYAASLK